MTTTASSALDLLELALRRRQPALHGGKTQIHALGDLQKLHALYASQDQCYPLFRAHAIEGAVDRTQLARHVVRRARRYDRVGIDGVCRTQAEPHEQPPPA